MTVRAMFAVGVAFAAFMACSAADAQLAFRTRLDTVPIDFRTRADTTGNGVVHATLDGRELTLIGTFENLAGPATEAWLHVGAAIGARGPAAHRLTVSHAPAGDLHGSIRLSTREVDALRAGRVYVQLHSQTAPEGNLWGWLLPEEQAR